MRGKVREGRRRRRMKGDYKERERRKVRKDDEERRSSKVRERIQKGCYEEMKGQRMEGRDRVRYDDVVKLRDSRREGLFIIITIVLFSFLPFPCCGPLEPKSEPENFINIMFIRMNNIFWYL